MSEIYEPTILVVDHSKLVRELLRETFLGGGFVVLLAAHGEEALERMAERRPDLVLTDVELPLLDGWELCSRLKQDPQTCDIPVVFLTSQREVPQRLRGLRLGAYDYLSKPFSPDELLLRVEMILDRTRSGAAAGERARAYLSGHTSHLAVGDVVQILAVNNKTGCLRLRCSEQGRVYFRDGRLTAAFTARTQGRKALYRIFAWNDADFHFDPHDQGDVEEHFDTSTQALLIDAFVAQDELTRSIPKLPDEHVPLGLTMERGVLSDPNVDLSPLEFAVIERVGRGATLRDLLDGIDEPDSEIAEALERLVHLEFIATPIEAAVAR
ncbi:MAG: response regulator [Acidobacteriota bacterium]|nr:MAG: response regulator [Acidobacteriota bacterium]